MLHEIPFTQYHLPNGRRTSEAIEVDPSVAEKARQIIEAGLVFECEILNTGHVSLTIGDPKEEIDVAIKLRPNGPGIREAVEVMVNEFDLEAFKKSKAEREKDDA